MKKNDGKNWKNLVIVLIFLVLTLQACSSLSDVNQAASTKATWTPVAQPTDQPYQVKTETLSYFGNTPVLVIFGSQDPEDATPLKQLNISTEDDYDVSSIPPASVSIWSRPIVAENKEVYFQVGDMLYVLSPGGQTRSIELPYDVENPAYCNWSWKGQLVCLNNAMTTGFLVDQDLNVVEMHLPADAGIDGEAYYEPYRVGENGIRTIYAIPEISNVRAIVFYKDLDLETLTVQSKRIRIEEDLYGTFYDGPTTNELDVMAINRKVGEIDVIGISESGDKVYLASHVTYTQPHISSSTRTRWWTDVYDGSEMDTINFAFEIIPSVGKKLTGDYLITGWLFDPENGINEQPTVYDLDAGKIILSASGSILVTEIVNFILPYADGWIAGDTLGMYYYRSSGNLMISYSFPEEIVVSMGPDSYYTVSQPLEP